MSDEKKYTERDMVEARREGAAYALNYFNVFELTEGGVRARAQFCKNAYPLPKVTRPRVVRDPDTRRGDKYEWALIDGHLKFRYIGPGGAWYKADGIEGGEFEPTVTRVKLWADLLSRPTEEVEADA